MAIDFVHLHTHTEYSLLDGASRIGDLVQTAKDLGMHSLAITDHGAMYGVLHFYKEAKKVGIHPIVGCEVYLAPSRRDLKEEIDGVRYYHLILLAENQTGYKNLVKLVSYANIEGMYYKPRIDKELLHRYHEGLICLSACIAGEIPRAILNNQLEKAGKLVEEYIDIFGKDNFFLELQDHGIAEEHEANKGLIELAKKYGVGLVVTNDLHYVHKEDSSFHDILLCLQTGKTLDDPTRMKFYNDEFYLKSPAEMYALFPEYPEAYQNTVKIAKRCQVDFSFDERYLPHFPVPDGLDYASYLKKLCDEKIHTRYQEITERVQKRVDYELDVIHSMGFDSYYLIVWDFVHFAKTHGIPVGPGRGSGAGSIIAYILGITDIDPLRYNLLFERFLNPERISMPDFDIDFCYRRRAEVIEYVKERYGEDHVSQIITFGTMAARGSVRDVGRVMGLPYNEVDKVAKLIPQEIGITIDKALGMSQELKALYEEDENIRRLIDFARQVEGLPRHASMHAAGIVIARNPVTDYMPVQVSEDNTWISQFDKDLVEELGLLKMDFLGLRTLTVLGDTVENIRKNRKEDFILANIPIEDEETSSMLTLGKTLGVFQMESDGMTTLMKELEPEGFSDLIPLVALYRPGPLGSGMVKDFIDGRHGKKDITYLHPLLEPILQETFGVVLYQEQVMQIVEVLAGFSLGQADILRRAMGKKKHDLLMKQKENFLTGTKQNGIDDKTAEHIFELLTHFADYGFNKSHSAAYAYIAWQTAYLKAHYPAEFMAAILTSVMDASEKVGVYIEECRHMGISILPPDINASSANFSVDQNSIRFGLAAVKNVGENSIKHWESVREEGGRFKSLYDFCSRVDTKSVNKRTLESLIKCGAFDSLGYNRAQLLSIMEETLESATKTKNAANSQQMGLFSMDALDEIAEIKVPDIKEVKEEQIMAWEKEMTGFYITTHPLKKYQNTLDKLMQIAEISDDACPDKKLVVIGGVATSAKRIATKKGEMMCFLTLEDFTHSIEVVVFPKIFYSYVNLLVVDMPLVIRGRVQKNDTETKVLAEYIYPLAEYLFTYYIFLSAAQNTRETLEKIRVILKAYPGTHDVLFCLRGQKKPFHLTDIKGLSEDKKIIWQLESLLGRGAVRCR